MPAGHRASKEAWGAWLMTQSKRNTKSAGTGRTLTKSLATVLLLSRDQEMLKQGCIARKICNYCYGTGRMLTTAKEWIVQKNPNAEIFLHGQEVNPEIWRRNNGGETHQRPRPRIPKPKLWPW